MFYWLQLQQKKMYLFYIYLHFGENVNITSHHMLFVDVVCLCSTCGLAEELEQESKGKQTTNMPKSACGSVSIFWSTSSTFSHIFSPIIVTCWKCKEVIDLILFVAVLPGRCIPMCQLSILGHASVQTGREDSAGQQDIDRCLKH